MLFCDIGMIDGKFQYHPHQFVGVKDGVVDYVGDSAPDGQYAECYDGAGHLLMPGLCNIHTHVPMTLMRGYAENLSLQNWLNTRVFPFEARLTGEHVYNGSLLSFAEMLRFGTVSCTDMYFFCDDIARAALDAGIKCNLSRAISCFDSCDLAALSATEEAISLARTVHGMGDGRLRVDMSLHAEYTSTPKIVEQLAQLTREMGLGMHLHLSETRVEHEECKVRRGGLTPAAYFEKMGLFGTPTTAAHCVWLENEDFDILARHGVTVANNPMSNLKLASGFCNVPRLLEKGINVGLGTDSVASNNSHNLFEEIKLFAVLSKALSGDPTVVAPSEALAAATVHGFRSQGRLDCGRIEPGCRADLIVLDVDRPWMQPTHDMVNNVVYSAQGSDVILTMVDGRVLYRDGIYPTIDIEKAIFNANQSTKLILSEL